MIEFWLQIVFEHTKDTYLVHICSIGARKIENLIFCQHSSTEHTATTSQRRIISIESTSELWIGHFAVSQFQPSIAFASSSLSTHHCEIQIRGAMMHTRDKQRWCIALLLLGWCYWRTRNGMRRMSRNIHSMSTKHTRHLPYCVWSFAAVICIRGFGPFSTRRDYPIQHSFRHFFFSLFLSFSSYSVFCMFDALARLAAFAMHASVYIIFFMLHNNLDFSHSQRTATWPHANANSKVRRGEHYMPCIYFCYHICIICMICRNVYDFFSVDFRYFLFICCVHRRSGENLTPPHCTRVYLLLAIWLLFVASEETTDYYYRRQRRCRIVFCISFRW